MSSVSDHLREWEHTENDGLEQDELEKDSFNDSIDQDHSIPTTAEQEDEQYVSAKSHDTIHTRFDSDHLENTKEVQVDENSDGAIEEFPSFEISQESIDSAQPQPQPRVTEAVRTARVTPLRSVNREHLSERREKRRSRMLSTHILRAKLAGSPAGSDNETDDHNESDDYEIDVDKTINIPQVPNFGIKSTSWNSDTDTVPTVQLSKLRLATGKSVSGFHEVENLQRQLTDCKIQLKLQRELLREQYGEESSAIKFLEKQFADENPFTVSKQTSDLANENAYLQKELQELVSSFEVLQGQLEHLQTDHEEWKTVSNDILDMILQCENTERVREMLLDAQASNSMKQKLQASGVALESILNVFIDSAKQLKRQQEQLKSNDEEIMRLEGHIKELSEKPLERSELISVEVDKKEQVRIRSEGLLKENHLKEQKIREMNDELNELKGVMEQKQHELDQYRQKVSALETERARLVSRINELDSNELKARMSTLNDNLNNSLSKQRQLSSEKIKLNYQLDELQKQLGNLESEVRDQENIIHTLRSENESLVAEVQEFEDRYQDFLTINVNFQTHLIKMLSQILDQKSVKEAAEKVLHLADREELQLDDTSTKTLYETVFQYDLSAIETIIDDHDRLTKEVKEVKTAGGDQTSQIVTDLRNKINELESTQKLENPTSKLRIDELTKRWKAAEEALAFERKQSKKRLEELDAENKELKAQLRMTSEAK